MSFAAGGQGDFFGDEPAGFAPVGAGADRIGVIDVGSNSVRLVVFDGRCRSPAVMFNEKVMCGLGAQLEDTGRLDPDGIERAIRALSRFAMLAPQLSVGALAGVATAAVRDAEDGPAFRDRVNAETGIRLRVASGADEARLAAKGVLFGNPRAEGVVVDLGGASVEFCRIAGGVPGPGLTTPLGPLRLRALGKRGGDVVGEIRRYLGTLTETYALDRNPMYLVGGAWRALARAQMARTDYPLKVLHEFTMRADEAADLGDWAANSRPERLAELPGVSSGRVQAMPLTGQLLAEMVRILQPGAVVVSAFGLREGVCLDNISVGVRAEDPLLSACREQEERRARAPGFGAELGAWVSTLFAPETRDDERLIRAAAYLGDVNWRTHPDFRAQSCWETVTRTTITDIGHRGRVFLGATLVARYRGSRKGDRVEALDLLDEGAEARALNIGYAMRLGATLAGSAPGVLAMCRLERDGDGLCLRLAEPIRRLAGEEVEKRLSQLGKAMTLATRIEIG